MYKNIALRRAQVCEDVRFNPCFNGSMYKNFNIGYEFPDDATVSILVLMDLCIKTYLKQMLQEVKWRFNPCFNGSMYKNKQ